MIKNKFKDDYQRIDAGQYRYIGKHFTLPMNKQQKTRTGWINMAAVAVFFVLELIAGLLNPDSSRTAWIVFPYLFLFLPTAYMGIGAFAYFGAPIRMEHSAYQNSLVRLRRSCIAIMVLAAACGLLDLIFLLIHRAQIHVGRELMYFGCFVLMELVGVCYGKGYDRMYGGIIIDE